MPRYKLTVAYDGSQYHGWQRQSTGVTIQEVMEKAGFRKEGERIKAQYHEGTMKDRVEYALNKFE